MAVAMVLQEGRYRMRYQVIVGNIGTVHDGDDLVEATTIFHDYCFMSSDDYGRASGEEVTLMSDGEPIRSMEGRTE